MKLIEYAVRVKGTQMYLPRSQRRDGRGGSWLNPIDFSKPRGQRGIDPRYETDMQIRSYATKRAAENLLTSWLKGKCYGDEEGGVWLKTVSERRREDMEIVEILLQLPT